jgi:ribosome-associated protein
MSSKQEEQQDNAAEDRLLNIVVDAIDDMKGVDLLVIDVRDMTSITDRMVITSGTSTRHVKSIADSVALKAKQAGFPALGVEGAQAAEWVLIDLGDVVVHVMTPAIREFYALEKLWAVVGDKSEND